jgi:hypothetical protein
MKKHWEEQIAVHFNSRKSLKDMGMDHPCDYCDEFVSWVVDIPGTDMFICKHCLVVLWERIFIAAGGKVNGTS